MGNKQINIVWCDDKVDSYDNDGNRETFARHNCRLFEKVKTSDALKKFLDDNKEKRFIDAVIVDFNVGDKFETPAEYSASGFRWVHEHYSEYAPIPFYLYSGRDIDFIKEKYKSFEFDIENDYFFSYNNNVKFKRNRYFQIGELEDLLSMIEEEVGNIDTPEFQTRRKFAKAFDAIEKFGLNGKIFIDILTESDNVDRYELCEKANPLRGELEKVYDILYNANVLPETSLNQLDQAVRKNGKHPEIYKLDSGDLMPEALADALKFFVSYTQDGSHNKSQLRLDFKNYLRDSADIYLVKSLTILCLDFIAWFYDFYKKYESRKPFLFVPFCTTIEEICLSEKDGKNKRGAIVKDCEGFSYWLQLQDGDNSIKEGDAIKINSRRKDCYYGKDFFVHYKSWELV